MKLFKYSAPVVIMAAAAVGSNAYAGGIGADFLQAIGAISPGQAHDLDKWHANVKAANPIYGHIEESTSRTVNQSVQVAAGPVGSALGQAVLNPINNNLADQRRAAVQERMRARMQGQCAAERMGYDPASNQCY